MVQSGPEPSSPVQVQFKIFLDRDWTNPRFFWTWTGLAWTALDQSIRAKSAQKCWDLLIYGVNEYTHLAICKSACTSHPSPCDTWRLPVTSVIFWVTELTHERLLTYYLPLTIHDYSLATHHSLLATCHSPLATCHSPLDIYHFLLECTGESLMIIWRAM